MKNALFVLISTLLISSQAFAAKVFVACSEGSPSSFNPQLATDGASFDAGSAPLFNRLLERAYGEAKNVPGLAESWEISKDGLTYTFHLRKGVKFHTTKNFKPKRSFNADDVLFSVNRQRLKTHPFHKVGGGTYEYFKSMAMGEIIKDVKKVGPYKVQFILTKPDATFLSNLAMDFMSIHSQEYAEQLIKSRKKEEMDTKPVGTGPFILEKYAKDSQIRYKKNPHYWENKVKIDKLVMVITPDPSVRAQKVKTGECHFATQPAPADLAALEKHPKVKIVSQAGLNVGYLAMNTEKKPFDNPKIRQAVNLALNKKAYLDAIYLGTAELAKNPYPPTIWAYNNGVKDYEYNPKKAKTILREAGFPKGFSTELWALPVSRPYNPNGKKMAEMMQADLAKVGIKAKIVTYDWPTYLAKSRVGEHQMLQLGWTSDNGDPDNFLGTLLGCAAVEPGQNRARWCYKPYDELIIKAKTTFDEKKRTEYYTKAQELFKTQAPWVTLAHARVFRSMVKNVKGYKIDPFGRNFFHRVELK